MKIQSLDSLFVRELSEIVQSVDATLIQIEGIDQELISPVLQSHLTEYVASAEHVKESFDELCT